MFIRSLCKKDLDAATESKIVGLIIEYLPIKRILDLSIRCSCNKELTTAALKACVDLSAFGSDVDTENLYKTIDGFYQMMVDVIIVPWVQICES